MAKKTTSQIPDEKTLERLKLKALEAKNIYDAEQEKYDLAIIEPKVASLVGSYMVYKGNTYGGGDPDEKWDTYARIVGHTDRETIETIIIEVDAHNCGSIKRKLMGVRGGELPCGYRFISKQAYDKEMRRVKKNLGLIY